MAIVEVKVPQLSESITEATLMQWKKKVGEAVAIDEMAGCVTQLLQRFREFADGSRQS